LVRARGEVIAAHRSNPRQPNRAPREVFIGKEHIVVDGSEYRFEVGLVSAAVGRDIVQQAVDRYFTVSTVIPSACSLAVGSYSSYRRRVAIAPRKLADQPYAHVAVESSPSHAWYTSSGVSKVQRVRKAQQRCRVRLCVNTTSGVAFVVIDYKNADVLRRSICTLLGSL